MVFLESKAGHDVQQQARPNDRSRDGGSQALRTDGWDRASLEMLARYAVRHRERGDARRGARLMRPTRLAPQN
jgi:hypothetical protein